MENCLILQVEGVGKCIVTQCLWPKIKNDIVPFLKCHIDYWWYFNNNIRNLESQKECLEQRIEEEARLLNEEEARLRTEKALLIVKEWSEEGSEKLVVARRILGSNPKAWNLISRYSVGKGAKKAAEEIKEHGKPIWKSRKVIEEKIIESLRSRTVNFIAICGKEGVGKKTMANKIMDMVKKDRIYIVVKVTVSKQREMLETQEEQREILEIQEEIAELLGLKFKVKFMSTRAAILRSRVLVLMTKYKILIIFEDVLKTLKLEDLGVPSKSEFGTCKILLTTRSKLVCKQMNAKKIDMEILTKEEAWILFEEKAGHFEEDSDLLSMAKEVAAACKGLPITLVNVGERLAGEEKHIWEDLLSQLRSSNPVDSQKILEDFIRLLN